MNTHLIATDRNKSVLNTYTYRRPANYLPFGFFQKSQAIISILALNGQCIEVQSRHYLLGNGYRSYNPIVMRFSSPDSLSPFGEGGLNCYAYGKSDPINYLDPTGHFPTRGMTNFFSATISDLQIEKLSKIHNLISIDPRTVGLLGESTDLLSLKTLAAKSARKAHRGLDLNTITGFDVPSSTTSTIHSRLMSIAESGRGRDPELARSILRDAYNKVPTRGGESFTDGFNYLRADKYEIKFRELFKNPKSFSGYANKALFKELSREIRF